MSSFFLFSLFDLELIDSDKVDNVKNDMIDMFSIFSKFVGSSKKWKDDQITLFRLIFLPLLQVSWRVSVPSLVSRVFSPEYKFNFKCQVDIL